MENYELYHYGTKGQKWGRRLYQNKDGSLTALGKVRYKTDKDFKSHKDREDNLAKARQARIEKKAAEDEKQRIVKSGNVDEVLSIKDKLSQQEMQSAYQRIQWEQNMKNLKPRDVNAGKTKADDIVGKMDKITNYAQSAAKFYNTVANVANAFNGEKIIPKIDTNITSGNKQDIKNRIKDKKGEGKKTPDIKDVLENPDKYDDSQVQAAYKRGDNLNKIDKLVNGTNNNQGKVDMDEIKSYVEQLVEEMKDDK